MEVEVMQVLRLVLLVNSSHCLISSWDGWIVTESMAINWVSMYEISWFSLDAPQVLNEDLRCLISSREIAPGDMGGEEYVHANLEVATSDTGLLVMS